MKSRERQCRRVLTPPGGRAGADVLVHEATNAFLPAMEAQGGATAATVRAKTITHGHSTPEMAVRGTLLPRRLDYPALRTARCFLPPHERDSRASRGGQGWFAHDVRAAVLVLTHFSSRYKPDDHSTMAALTAIAAEAFGGGSGGGTGTGTVGLGFQVHKPLTVA